MKTPLESILIPGTEELCNFVERTVAGRLRRFDNHIITSVEFHLPAKNRRKSRTNN